MLELVTDVVSTFCAQPIQPHWQRVPARPRVGPTSRKQAFMSRPVIDSRDSDVTWLHVIL